MSIVDSDKTNHDRSSPTPSSHDTTGIPRMAQGTQSIQPKVKGTPIPGFVRTTNGQIVANDGVTNIGLFGFDSDGKMKIKVAQPGFDVFTATPDKLIFNSGQDIFKIVQTGTISVTIDNTIDTAQEVIVHQPHGLSFVPIVIAVVSGTDLSGHPIYVPLPYNDFAFYTDISGHYTQQVVFNVQAYADDTNVSVITSAVYALTDGADPTWVIKFYLLQETAA